MAGKEGKALLKAYQSDPGETEDEEVKRNCIMGESGMRDSDFFDTDTDADEENGVDHNDDESVEEEPEEEQMVHLVKFVSVGSQILKPKGVALCRPTPIVPTTVVHAKKPDDGDEASNASNVKM